MSLVQCELCLAVCMDKNLVPVRLGWMDESKLPKDVTALVCPECSQIYQDELGRRQDEQASETKAERAMEDSYYGQEEYQDEDGV